MQLRPIDARPLAAGNDYQIETELTAIAEEIAALIRRATQKPRLPMYRGQRSRRLQEVSVRPGETGQRRADQPVRYSGQTKIAICSRLLTDWSQLADYLDVPLPDRARFDEVVNRRASGSGSKPADDSRIWPERWLPLVGTILWRSCSPALARPTAASSACPGGSAWRGAQTLLPGLRGALVGRALCPGQALRAAYPTAGSGEDTPGPRWQRMSETLHDLGEVLARVPEPAVVVLGPPGSGRARCCGIMSWTAPARRSPGRPEPTSVRHL